MEYIGEFQKNSTILFELLTIDEENQLVIADFPPTAVIEIQDQNGLQVVDNVTLEATEDHSRYVLQYTIPNDWLSGEYIITYSVTVQGTEYTIQEKFSVIENDEEDLSDEYNLHEIDEEDFSADQYIPSSDFQTPASIEVKGDKIIITLNESIKYNHSYMVVLDKRIQSTEGVRLEKTKTISFSSEYKPLLATPIEVRSVLKGLYKYFSTHDVYVAIRDAGQKAFQLLGRQPDPNNSRYREYTERETTYFATGKFVLYEAARNLLTNLMINVINDDFDDIGEGGSIKLGDFSISDGSGSSSASGEPILEKINAFLIQIERYLKFWQDAMMGHNRRGYARPVSGSFRTSDGSPEGRDLE